jgi:inner membrane transporter RhtA
MNLAYFQTIALVPLGVASTLELLGPIGLAVALTRRLTDLLWALLAVVGVVLLGAPGNGAPVLAGIGMGVLAAICRAGYVVLNRRIGRLFPDWTGLALALAAGAGVLAPAGAITGGARLLDPAVLATGVLVALLSSLLPYMLDLLVLRRISARLFGILLSISPVAAALVGLVVLGQALTTDQVVAIGLIVVAGVGAVADDARTHPVSADGTDRSATER